MALGILGNVGKAAATRNERANLRTVPVCLTFRQLSATDCRTSTEQSVLVNRTGSGEVALLLCSQLYLRVALLLCLTVSQQPSRQSLSVLSPHVLRPWAALYRVVVSSALSRCRAAVSWWMGRLTTSTQRYLELESQRFSETVRRCVAAVPSTAAAQSTASSRSAARATCRLSLLASARRSSDNAACSQPAGCWWDGVAV